MTPIEELKKRIVKLQTAMQKEEIGGALIVQRADLFYFSGTGQNAHLFVPATGESTLLVKRSFARAGQESALAKIELFQDWKNLIALVTDSVQAGSKIGLETDVIPANLYFRYQKMLSSYEIVDISRPIRQIRSIKSPYEISLMREAAKIGEAVFDHARIIIREGMSEVDLAAGLESMARTLGHQGAVRMRGFNQEIYYGHVITGKNAAASSFFDGPTGGSGLNPSFPQGAGRSIISRNDPVLIDFVFINGGYIVDQTRIFCLGKPPQHLQEAYKQAVSINKTLAEKGRAGLPASVLYQKALEMASAAGLKNHFMGYTEKVNFIGHGVGLELDELPIIAPGFDQPLETGMVFALEPKFIFPDQGAIGIEDTYVVESKGLKKLTSFSDQLQIL
jgi:Xaa-Pro dipeptidase